ncbi:tyrosine-type recombinase/integrase [Porphyrobacter sp. CACIAM 03H1]|uniref:tyrosine-type recombinase/integrase n=1 Tax=Porphyrobacter sp. CACIAM 03H1 TaxID=2003315 RepID=UPI000B5A8860|nr:integrase arm-type DNA-binding domain-containing protein [Porphyrobacter sp. CACIAM 03H1]ASJ92020.1 integrase [Porphyrobacter sp. CACIAM 03H1]
MLSEMAVRQAKAKDKDYKLSDSEGLYLFVAKSGRRSWRLKYRFAGKERRLILGAYPELSLKEARDRKCDARKLLAEGRDPGLEAKKAAIARAMSASNTFEVVARNWFALQEDRWTPVHARDVISSLEKEVFPWIGGLPIAELDEPIVLSVLRKIEKRGAIETAHRVRQRMSAVFVQAIAEGLAARDPAAVVGKALKPVPRGRKRPAIVSIEALHDMIRKTEAELASPLTKLASRFAALTAQRLGAIRSMAWGEFENIDWDGDGLCPEALWRVPAGHMKLANDLKQDEKFDHLVPLAPETVAVLRAAKQLTGRGPIVFPSNRSARVPMSENTLSYFYNRCGYQGRHVPHGWRASFSTIMNEWAERNGTASDRLVIDLMLAHIPEGVSGSEGAYNRAAFLERRREIAEVWAKMLFEGFPEPSKLLGLPAR